MIKKLFALSLVLPLFALAEGLTPDTIVVSPLTKTKWNQGNIADYEESSTERCYNYYTPYNYPCGCVATAGAQLTFYHRFPIASISPMAISGTRADGTLYPVNTIGGVFDWDKMVLDPAATENSITEEQREAIGHLTFDISAICLTQYNRYSPGSDSLSFVYMLQHCLGLFGYASAQAGHTEEANGINNEILINKILIPNLIAKLPVVLALRGDNDTSHVVLADGFGYKEGEFIVHINQGWSGEDDGWFSLPNIGKYNIVDGFVCNVYPRGVANGTIVTGQVKNNSGEVLIGATVSAGEVSTKTDEKGYYALYLNAGSHTINATYNGTTASQDITVQANTLLTIDPAKAEYSGTWSINNLSDVNLVINGVESKECVVTFMGDDGEIYDSVIIEKGSTVQRIADREKEGYEFAGWFTAADGGEEFDFTNTIDGDINIYAHFTPHVCIITFYSYYGGECTMEKQEVSYGTKNKLRKNTYTNGDKVFRGWTSDPFSDVVLWTDEGEYENIWDEDGSEDFLYGLWRDKEEPSDPNDGKRFKVRYVYGGGLDDYIEEVTYRDFVYEPFEVPSIPGHTFDGWFTDTEGKNPYQFNTPMRPEDLTLYAGWDGAGVLQPKEDEPEKKQEEQIEEGKQEEQTEEKKTEEKGQEQTPSTREVVSGFELTAKTIYDGVLIDAANRLHGTVQMTAAKPNAKTRQSKLTANVILAQNGQKLAFKNGIWEPNIAKASLTGKGGEELIVTLSEQGLSGNYGAWRLIGAERGKDKDSRVGLVAFKKTGGGWSYISAAFGAKGKVKVSGLTDSGVKLSATTQLIKTPGEELVPVMITKKANLAFLLQVHNGQWDVIGLEGADEVVSGASEQLVSNAKLDFNVDTLKNAMGEVDESLLPRGIVVNQAGNKFVINKDAAKPSALKLKYKAKDSTFTGSFKVFQMVNGRNKAVALKVNGVVINGIGYGTATSKRPALSLPVEIK